MFGRRTRRPSRDVEGAENNPPFAPELAQPSLARDTVVAAIDPASGRLWGNIRPMVAVALLLELAREGRLDVSGTGKKVAVTVRDRTPLGNDVLDAALVTIDHGYLGQKVRRLLRFLPKEDDVLSRLISSGELVEEPPRGIGFFPAPRYRPTPAAGRDQLVASLRSALLGESIPDDRTALLISAISMAMPVSSFVPKDRVEDADHRAQEMLERIGVEERALRLAVREAMTDASRSDGSAGI